LKIINEGGESLEIAWYGSGTAGTRDGIICIELFQSNMHAKREMYIEAEDLERFQSEIDELVSGTISSAALVADDSGQSSIKISPLDSLGHFLLVVEICDLAFIRQRNFEIGLKAAYKIDTGQVHELATVCKFRA